MASVIVGAQPVVDFCDAFALALEGRTPPNYNGVPYQYAQEAPEGDAADAHRMFWFSWDQSSPVRVQGNRGRGQIISTKQVAIGLAYNLASLTPQEILQAVDAEAQVLQSVLYSLILPHGVRSAQLLELNNQEIDELGEDGVFEGLIELEVREDILFDMKSASIYQNTGDAGHPFSFTLTTVDVAVELAGATLEQYLEGGITMPSAARLRWNYATSARFHVQAFASARSSSGSYQVELLIGKQPAAGSMATIPASGVVAQLNDTTPEAIAAQAIVELAQNDEIGVLAARKDGAAADLVLDRLTLVMTRVG